MLRVTRPRSQFTRRVLGVAGRCAFWLTTCLLVVAPGCGQGEQPGPHLNLDVSAAPEESPASESDSAALATAASSADASAPQASVETSAAPSASTPPPATSSASIEQLAVPSEGRLMTRVQYDASVRDVFKGLVHGPFTSGFPVENEVAGFGTNSRSHQASSWLVEAHLLAAEAVSTQVIATLSELLPCAATEPDSACGHAFIDVYAERAFRRLVMADELAPLYVLFDEVLDADGFETAVGMCVESLLQSPQFLYRLETSQELVAPGVYRVSDSEMASRLSYFFWNSIPDEELRQLATERRLHEVGDIESQARRLAADPRTQETLQDFTTQWLGIQKLDSASRITPLGTGTELSAAWRASLSRYAAESLWGPDGGIETLLLSPRVYLNDQLAPIYGATVPDDTAAGELFATEFPGQRLGLLTQPGLMALLAHPDQSAPIQRGVFIRERLLCQPTPAPPPSANPFPPDPDPTLTTRERFEVHTQQPDCAGCHRMIDGMGLPLENFDQIGAYRDQENGLPIDVKGEIYGTLDTSISGVFFGSETLALRLASSYQVRDCLVIEWYRYSRGRYDETVDLSGIQSVAEAAETTGGGFAEIMVRLAVSEGFRYRKEAAVDEVQFQ